MNENKVGGLEFFKPVFFRFIYRLFRFTVFEVKVFFKSVNENFVKVQESFLVNT